MTNEPLLVINDLRKSYPSGNEELTILNGLSFAISNGISAAIRGESGSGKSTLLNILGGLDRATSGTVIVGGHELGGMGEQELTRYRSSYIGFVFQFHYLLKDFTALENVMLPAFVAGMPKRQAMDKAAALLADINMETRSHHYPSQLSGGERQRVAVARSLINDPEVVLADEPTGNLDPSNSAIVADILYALVGQRGKTLIVVTHDERVAARADRQFYLEAGIFAAQADS